MQSCKYIKNNRYYFFYFAAFLPIFAANTEQFLPNFAANTKQNIFFMSHFNGRFLSVVYC